MQAPDRELQKFIFTYGSDTGGGWTEVFADTAENARLAYLDFHPMLEDGRLPYCRMLTQEAWEKTSMFAKGTNLGRGLRDTISISTQLGDEP